MSNLISFLIVGLIAGWLASMFMEGRGLGVVGDIVVGVIGALIGGYLFNQFGITTSTFLGKILVSLIGAIVLLFLISFIKRE